LTTFQQVDINHERSLTSQLKAFATDKALKGPQRVSRSIHGSGYWKCGRSQVYGLLGYEPSDPKYVWAWDLAAKHGDLVHGHIQQEFVDSGKVVILPNGKSAIEVTISAESLPETLATEFNSYRLGCRIDAILSGSTGLHIPVEIKTVDHKYLAGSERKYLPEKLADYESQLQMSLHWWRNPATGERSQFGLIYVISRGDISLREEYVIEYNSLFIESELERVAVIRDYWLKTELPAPEPHRGPCNFCVWRSICPAPESQKK
jgi:CRISPR/Cas system-associated exonuclease Cas4 (RecB family)